MYQILLVDDEQNVLNALQRELKDEYGVEAFSSPAAALQRCREARFDLVIADYQMPGMNGIQFLKQFGKIQPDAARLILSGQADTNALISAINETHIYRFIGKPWDKVELAGTIAQALAYRKVMLENRRLTEACRAQRNWERKFYGPDKLYQVLVVGDEPNVLNVAARDLTSRSTFQDFRMVMMNEADPESPLDHSDFRFNVYTTTSPLQALERAKQVSSDVVIADYLMKEMDGLRFLEAFREIQPAAARILLSGHADMKILTDAINRLEIYSFIGKPWRDYELKSAVTQAIACRNLLQDNQRLAQLLS